MKYQDIKEGLKVRVTEKHRSYTGELIKKVNESYTKVIIRDTERGEGWNKFTNRYEGIKTKNGWMRGENYGFNEESEVHIKNIEIIN